MGLISYNYVFQHYNKYGIYMYANKIIHTIDTRHFVIMYLFLKGAGWMITPGRQLPSLRHYSSRFVRAFPWMHCHTALHLLLIAILRELQLLIQHISTAYK